MRRRELLLAGLLLAGCGSGSDSHGTDAGAGSGGVPVAKILAKHCSVCHAPPSPKLHKKEEWPNVIRRMDMHRIESRMPALSKEEHDDVLAYLQAHAK